MEANIYRIFRTVINDTATAYTIVDLVALRYLDRAIDALSSKVRYTFKEVFTPDASDITNGYIDFAREIQDINLNESGPFPERTNGNTWEHGGGKRIRFIESNVVTAGQEYTVKYRAKYNKFDGAVKQQSEMDVPTEAEMPVALYALGEYMQFELTPEAKEGVIGAIKSRSEDNISVSYGMGMSVEELNSPEAIKKVALEMFMNLPNAQDAFFSLNMGNAGRI